MNGTNGTNGTNASKLEKASCSISSVLARAIHSKALSDTTPVAVFYDIPCFSASCKSLVDAFPPNSLHGFAVKACPVVSIIRAAAEMGMGGECASEGEVALCLAAGLSPDRIILDSPAKTDAIIKNVLAMGVHLNADNFDELDTIDKLYSNSTSTIGLRVNPQTGAGTIAMTSTAGKSSKFGVPLRETRAQVIDAFVKYPWLKCVHVHVGSQGCTPDLLVNGVIAAVELADEINSRAEGCVTDIDIGGGLSVDYKGDTKSTVLKFDEYAAMLREKVPNLFNYRILSEFGRRLVTPVGFIAARVQAVKSQGSKNYVVCHAGADLVMRAAYAPDKWRHDIEIYDGAGRVKSHTGDDTNYDVAGPLCFSGDIIATDRTFNAPPQIGDTLVVRDAGGYTIGMYSRHTSQLVPAVYGYFDDAGDLKTLKKRETKEDLVRFWGGDCTI